MPGPAAPALQANVNSFTHRGRRAWQDAQHPGPWDRKGDRTAVELRAGDVFLTRGQSLLSRAIRFFSRGIGEKRTKANHVGVVVEGGPVEAAIVVEAISRVRRHPLTERYGSSKTQVALYRPINLSPGEVATVVETAESYVGRAYGYLVLAAHLADWALLGAYVFRRLTREQRYPICSWLVAHAFGEAGKHFGVEPGAAQPDDIHDFVEANPDKYERLQDFRPL